MEIHINKLVIAMVLFIIGWEIYPVIFERETKLEGEISKIPPPAKHSIGFVSVCLDGVKYYVVTGYHETNFAPALNQDGTPKMCKKEELKYDDVHPLNLME